jgi:hypothetical protein
VRDYWQRQRAEIDPPVEPVELGTRPDGRVAVRVHQVVRDAQGGVLSDNEVVHVYEIEGDLVRRMSVEATDDGE